MTVQKIKLFINSLTDKTLNKNIQWYNLNLYKEYENNNNALLTNWMITANNEWNKLFINRSFYSKYNNGYIYITIEEKYPGVNLLVLSNKECFILSVQEKIDKEIIPVNFYNEFQTELIVLYNAIRDIYDKSTTSTESFIDDFLENNGFIPY